METRELGKCAYRAFWKFETIILTFRNDEPLGLKIVETFGFLKLSRIETWKNVGQIRKRWGPEKMKIRPIMF